MNIPKRAFLYICRNIGKNILLFCLILILAFSVFSGFSVIGSCNTASQNTIKNKADSVDFMFNRVVGFDFSLAAETLARVVTGTLTSQHIDWIYEDYEFKTYNAQKKVFMDTSLLLYGYKEGKNSNAYFYAVNETTLHDFFRINAFELTEGRHIAREDENVCVISEDLAFLNNLQVGDIIYPECKEDMIKPGGKEDKKIIEACPMEIIGIYKMNFDYTAPDDAYIYELPQNMIFADHISTKLWQDEIAKATNQPYMSNIDTYDKVTFFTDNIKTIEDIEAVYASDTSKSVNKNSVIYGDLAAALNSINITSILISSVACTVTIILLFVFSSKFGKSRKKEYIILLKSGISKKQIFAQRLFELAIVASIATVLAFLLANLLIDPISDSIKAADAARVFEPYSYEYLRAEIQFGPQITQNGYLPEDFEITLNSSAVILGIVSVFASAVISALISSSSVLKKKIFEMVEDKEQKTDED